MLIVDNKEYRNIQQQVAENANDIAKLKDQVAEDANDIEELKDDKQDTLVSGTNIKTINGTSLLGAGDIQIGEGGTTVTGGNGIIVSSEGEISIDTSVVAELSDIPTKTSDLQNDSGFITSSAIHTYTAGTGIDITNDVVSVNNNVAMKSDIPSYSAGTGISLTNNVIAVNNNVAMKSDIPTYTAGSGIDITNNKIGIDNTVALKSEIPTKTSALQNDSGFITSSAIPTYTAGTGININSSKVVSVDNTVALKTDIPTYTAGTGLNLNNNEFSINNTVALKTDIPTYTGGSGITINSGNVVSADSTLARVADIPSITGLTMYNYKITISGLDGGNPSTPRSAVYIMSVPYQLDTSSYNAIQIIRLIPVWSVVVDTDTTAGNKNIGRFHWQTSAIALIDWVDGTHTVMDFTGSFNATISAAAPAHW